MYIHIYIYTYILICLFIYLFVYLFVNLFIYLLMYSFLCVHIYIYGLYRDIYGLCRDYMGIIWVLIQDKAQIHSGYRLIEPYLVLSEAGRCMAGGQHGQLMRTHINPI